jgi:hypothetical protein
MDKNRIFIITQVLYIAMVLSITSGCSTICPDGFKFGPYAALCAPYDGYKLIKSIDNDLQPGGMLHPNNTRMETKSKFANYSTNLAPDHPIEVSEMK